MAQHGLVTALRTSRWESAHAAEHASADVKKKKKLNKLIKSPANAGLFLPAAVIRMPSAEFSELSLYRRVIYPEPAIKKIVDFPDHKIR